MSSRRSASALSHSPYPESVFTDLHDHDDDVLHEKNVIHEGCAGVAIQLSIESLATHTVPEDGPFRVSWCLAPSSHQAAPPNNGVDAVQYSCSTRWLAATLQQPTIPFHENFRMSRVVLPLTSSSHETLCDFGDLKTLRVQVEQDQTNATTVVWRAKIAVAYSQDGGKAAELKLKPLLAGYPPAVLKLSFRMKRNDEGRVRFKANGVTATLVEPQPIERTPSPSVPRTTFFGDDMSEMTTVHIEDAHHRKRHNAQTVDSSSSAQDAQAILGHAFDHFTCCYCGVDVDEGSARMTNEKCRGHTHEATVHWGILSRNVAVGLGAGLLVGAGLGAVVAAKAVMMAAYPMVGAGVGGGTGTAASFTVPSLDTRRHPCCGQLEGEPCLKPHTHKSAEAASAETDPLMTHNQKQKHSHLVSSRTERMRAQHAKTNAHRRSTRQV
eukprot:PhM_4_TR14889/c0_g1_i1/m.107133